MFQDYVVLLKFRDGTAGEIDLEPVLFGEVFGPLKDLNFFKQFKIHPDFHTLVWPYKADLAPEHLQTTLESLLCCEPEIRLEEGEVSPRYPRTQIFCELSRI
jgi:hypothetical protein